MLTDTKIKIMKDIVEIVQGELLADPRGLAADTPMRIRAPQQAAGPLVLGDQRNTPAVKDAVIELGLLALEDIEALRPARFAWP